MKISVITVCYNSEKSITDTIESVLSQTHNDLEYIIIDGSSSDSTVEIIKSYEKKFHLKNFEYKWISEPDNGIYDAMNKGIALANGEIIGIINSDDHYFNEDTLRKVSEEFLNKNNEAIYGNLLLNKRKNIQKLVIGKVPKKINGFVSHKMRINHPTFFIRKSVYEKIGCFDTNFIAIADKDLIIRMIKNKIKILKLEETLAVMSTQGLTGEVRSLWILKRVVKENYRIGKNNNFPFFETMFSIIRMVLIVLMRYIKYSVFSRK